MNNYEMVKKIGAGSFGSVYLCVQKSTAKHCVMKRIELRALNDKERHSAHQEAKLLSQLDHPNIVQHVDTLCSRSKLYLFMQYCEGGDLEHRIQSLKETSGALGEPQLLDWFVQMALALEYLHSRRILHRDLKSANVLYGGRPCRHERPAARLRPPHCRRLLRGTARTGQAYPPPTRAAPGRTAPPS